MCPLTTSALDCFLNSSLCRDCLRGKDRIFQTDQMTGKTRSSYLQLDNQLVPLPEP